MNYKEYIKYKKGKRNEKTINRIKDISLNYAEYKTHIVKLKSIITKDAHEYIIKTEVSSIEELKNKLIADRNDDKAFYTPQRMELHHVLGLKW